MVHALTWTVGVKPTAGAFTGSLLQRAAGWFSEAGLHE